MSSPTLGPALVSRADVYIERYGIPYADVSVVDDTVLTSGSSQTLIVGTLSLVGGITTGGDFGGQARHHWTGGLVGLDSKGNGVSAWSLPLPARPYHHDGGVMLGAVLADLERDAATGVGASPLGAVLDVDDVRLDVAGSWIRPAAIGRDLLDALAVAAGQPRGAWWVAADGSTHLGLRPARAVTLADLTVDPFDPALRRAVVRVASDDFAPLVPGAILTAPGLPAPLSVAALVVHVDGDDISAELWGEASHAELLARVVRHVMAPTVDYLPMMPYSVTSVAGDGRVAVAAPPSGPFPDAPLIGHAPGIPGASYTMAPGALVLVACVGGSPGAPVCVGYPAGTLPASVGFDGGSVTVGGSAGSGSALAIASKSDARDAALLAGVNAALSALSLPPITLPTSSAATKAMGV